jgi:hypothetical protein
LESGDGEIQMSVEYMDPLHPLGDSLIFIILSEEELQIETCEGGGKGWQSEYVDIVSLRSDLSTLLAKAQPRNPVWLVQFVAKGVDLGRKLIVR